MQPFVKALPLTALNDALRAVILEGADLASQLGRIGDPRSRWGVVSFVAGAAAVPLDLTVPLDLKVPPSSGITGRFVAQSSCSSVGTDPGG